MLLVLLVGSDLYSSVGPLDQGWTLQGSRHRGKLCHEAVLRGIGLDDALLPILLAALEVA